MTYGSATPSTPTRSDRERRDGRDRRAGQRRRVKMAGNAERRESERRAHQRRGRNERRNNWHPRPAQTRRDAAQSQLNTGLTPRDRTRARLIPDDFVLVAGSTSQRVTKVVRKKWPNAPLPVRAGIAQGLRPVLDPLANGEAVSETMRDSCEQVVATWLTSFRRR